MRKLALVWAHFFFLGFFPLFPGTFTSLVVALLYWGLLCRIALIWKIALLVFVVLTGIPASSVAQKFHGKKDPRSVVIDEVAGQFMALLPAISFSHVVLGFILFRLFDTLKPPPINLAEKLDGGAGVVLDDLAAGAMALAVLLFLQFL